MHALAREEVRRFRFEGFVVDARTGEIWREGEALRLQEVPFRFLVALLQCPGELVTREELRGRIWPPGINLDFESAIDTAARKVRQALGDAPKDPRFIETLPGRGYRFLAIVEVVAELPSQEPRLPASGTPSLAWPGLRGWILLSLVLSVVGVAAAVAARSVQERARLKAVLEITRLVEAREYHQASALLGPTRLAHPGDPELERLWLASTAEHDLESEPPGAEVFVRPAVGGDWVQLGRTPLARARVAKGSHLWRFEKPGFEPFVRYSVVGLASVARGRSSVRLDAVGTLPPGMVRVPVSGAVSLRLPGLGDLKTSALGDFLIDRTEVTHAEYKKFVDAGGYATPSYWKVPFVKAGRVLKWEEAIGHFRDATGRPGPAGWESGTHPRGMEQHPVAGISWFEAAAYAEFAGKQLPTVFHWQWASQPAAAPFVAPTGNFHQRSTWPVGSGGTLGSFGTRDMAGNVKEWCWNEDASGRRFLLGGGFGEPPYMFVDADAQSPWERRLNCGFRCMVTTSALDATLCAKLETVFRDYAKERPVPEAVFRAYKRLYAFDRANLDAKVEEREEKASWVREKIVLEVGYGGERLPVHLYLPRKAPPPYQAVVWFPGSNAVTEARFNPQDLFDHAFVPESGRALVVPIYRGMYERKTDLASGHPSLSATYREHLRAWAKEFSRTLDYLETRPDIDRSRIAYLGRSLGARIAPILLAEEDRIRAAILVSGGLRFAKVPPEADPLHFLPRVKTPILMINGRFDFYFPVETAQLPFLRHLGTPAADRRHAVYNATHAPPYPEWIRESLDWLDRYLGPVPTRR